MNIARLRTADVLVAAAIVVALVGYVPGTDGLPIMELVLGCLVLAAPALWLGRSRSLQRETQLRASLDNIPGAIVHTDENLDIIVCSNHFHELYQVPKELLVVGAHYPNFLAYLASNGYYGPGNAERQVADRIAMIRNPTDQVREDKLPNGRMYEVRRKLDGLGGTITTVADITERKASEAELESARSGKQKALHAFASQVSGFARSIKDGQLDERLDIGEAEDILQSMHRDLNDLAETIETTISEVGSTFSSVTRGDLSQRVVGEYKGVFGQLAIDTNATIARLDSVVTTISETAREVAAATAEITSGSRDLSERTEQQAASLEETAASMEEISATVA